MNLLHVGFLIICYVLTTSGYSYFDVANVITNATNVIADYFSTSCIYFISNKYSKSIVNNKIIKRLTGWNSKKFGKTIGFCNLTNFNDLLNREAKDQCHNPIRIVLQLNDTKFIDEFDDFNKTYSKNPEKLTCGIWLIFIKSLKDDFVENFFEGVYMPFDVELIVASVNGTEVHFKDVYQVDPSFPLRQPYFGKWSLKTGLLFPKNPSRYFRRTDLEGLRLKVDYIDGNEPFIMTNALSGYLLDIWRILENRMNMTSIFKKVKLRRDRDASKNSWLQIMNEILLQRTDVGLADFISTSTRVNMFDFSYPLFVTKIFDNEVLSHTLLLPFENEIWIAAFIWFLIHSLTIFSACRLSRRLAKSKEIVLQLPTSFLVTFGGICGQGLSKTPKTSSCRILFLLIFVVAAVVIPSYSASLTRYLTAKPSKVAFKDLRSFYEINTHRMIVVYGSFEFHLFNISKQQAFEKKIFERYIKNKQLPKTYKEALELICYTEKTAFYTITSHFLREWKKKENKYLEDDCVLRKMSQHAGMLLNGLIYRKHFRFKGLIDHHLKALQSAGIIDRLKTKYWGEYPARKRKPWESVSLQESTALFQILIFGIILALMVGFVEVLTGKRNPKKVMRGKRHTRRLLLLRKYANHAF